MTLSTNFIQEQMSWAYIRAVTFRAGFNLSEPILDVFGIDGTIVSMIPGVNRVGFQLKSTTRFLVAGDAIHYDLRVEDYNRLIKEDDLPRVLILYVMPSDDSQWLIQSPNGLCLRTRAYWVPLMGGAPSNNSSTVRVAVPVANVFDQDGLREMFRRLIV